MPERPGGKAMPVGGSGANYGHSGTGDGQHVKTKTTHDTTKDTTSGGNGVKKFISNLPSVKLATMAYKGVKSIFQPKTEQQKVQANINKGYDVNNPAEMRSVEKGYKMPSDPGGGNRHPTTLITTSVVSSPTADKAKDAHSWDFKAYDNQQAETKPNVYDYNKAPYAKKGKLVRKYATGQEIKNFSKGKRFGPPPLKGPDPQGLQVILENSDYFKKLIG